MRVKAAEATKEILVCQAGSCRGRGSEAVLLEIEELANALVSTSCSVQGSGCLGLCNQAPSAVIVTKKGKDLPFGKRLQGCYLTTDDDPDHNAKLFAQY